MNGSSQVLWRRWRERRDRRALAAVVEAHVGYAYDFARRVAVRAADAEDLAQQAFLELTEVDPQVPERVGLRAFLGRRIVLGAKTLARAALTRRRIETKAVPPIPPDRVADLETQDAVHAALDLLDEEQREAVVLRYLHELSYAEIAHVLGIREESARMRVHRAMRRLRGRLGPGSEAAIAALALWPPPAGLAPSTVKVATLMGGVVVMGATARKLISLAILITLVFTGAVIVHAGRGDAPVSRAERADGPAAPEARAEAPGTGVPEDIAVPPAPEPGGAGPARPPRVESTPVTGTVVRGTLRFTDGAPVQDAEVSLGPTLQPVALDRDGHFVIEGVKSGDHFLGLCFGRGNRVSLGEVLVTPEQVKDLLIEVERGVVLEGTVVADDSGEPMAEVLVLVSRIGGDAARRQGRFVNWLTDAQGRFRVPYLPPGTYSVTVDPSTFRPSGYGTVSRRVEVDAQTGPLTFRVEPTGCLAVRLMNVPPGLEGTNASLYVSGDDGSGGNHGFAATLAEGKLVEFDRPAPGRYRITLVTGHNLDAPLASLDLVVNASTPPVVELRLPGAGAVRGSVAGAAGQPLAKRRLRLMPDEEEVKTDESGAFHYPFVKPGTYDLFVRSGTGWISAGELEVRLGETATVDAQLPGTGAIHGLLNAPRMRDGARIYLATAEDSRLVGTAQVDALGEFRFEHLEAGSYIVVARTSDSPMIPREVVVRDGEVADAGEFLVERAPEAPLHIVVPAGTKPPQKVEISLAIPGPDHVVQLDGKGRGTLTLVPAGTWTATVSAEGFESREIELKLPSAEPLRIELQPK
ncbi:MAG: sigma-70 family RNA polymerase sigma factor [Planctomycetota bacterium]